MYGSPACLRRDFNTSSKWNRDGFGHREEGGRGQSDPSLQATLQNHGLSAKAMAMPLEEEVESGDFSQGGSEKRKWWMTVCYPNCTGLAGKKIFLSSSSHISKEEPLPTGRKEEKGKKAHENIKGHYRDALSTVCSRIQQKVCPQTSGIPLLEDSSTSPWAPPKPQVPSLHFPYPTATSMYIFLSASMISTSGRHIEKAQKIGHG